jgi:hypothetical protein
MLSISAYGQSSDSFTITENGNIGIGTTSPSSVLSVDLSDSGLGEKVIFNMVNGHTFSILNNASGGSPRLECSNNLIIKPTGGVYFMDPSGVYSSVISLSSGVNTYFNAFGGNVGIGNSSPQVRLDVSGVVRAQDFAAYSDAVLKEDVKPISNALDRLTLLRGVNFRWKDESFGEGEDMGLVAQEVEAAFPEAVSTDSEGVKSVSYQKLVAPLIEAVKTLKSENDDLRARVEALEAKVGRK